MNKKEMSKKIKEGKMLTLILGVILLCIGSLILYAGHTEGASKVPLYVLLLAFLSLGMGSVFLYVKKMPLPVLVIAIVFLMIGYSVLYVCLSPMYDGADEFTVKAVGGEDRIVKVNETVVFNGSLSTAGDIEHLASSWGKSLFVWDFDSEDGIKGDDVGVVVEHTYTELGTYTVTLIVIVSVGAGWEEVGVGMDTITVTVTE